MAKKVEELKEDVFTQVQLDDLQYFWLPNGAPCFVANRKDICEQVEGLGFQIYYLIANQESVVNTTSSKGAKNKGQTPATYTYQQVTHKGKLIKVVKNIVGRAVGVAEEDLGKDLCSFKEEANYSLPPIPRVMADKLDEFFRLVHAQHGTESIVILTFDTTKEESDGWGILVPEQTNTAAHCKYDPDSVAALKEDHIIIVGSVHSHPEMPAYASGTDHEDQADFDGLHITYGWQNSVSNGRTQYHAELQMGGSNYIIDINDVFESFIIAKNPDPEVVEWTEKVKKSQPQVLGAYNTQQHQSATTYYNNGITTTGHLGTTSFAGAYGSRFVQGRKQFIPKKILDNIPSNAVIIAEIDTTITGRTICPSCKQALFKDEVDTGGACVSCDIPLIGLNTNINTTIGTLNVYQNKRNRSLNVPYYLWTKGYENSGEYVVLLIKEEIQFQSVVEGVDGLKVVTYKEVDFVVDESSSNDSDYVHLPTDDFPVDDDGVLQYDLRKEFEDRAWQEMDNGGHTDVHFAVEYWSTRTWCCEENLMTLSSSVCNCPIMVTDEDEADYDEFCNKNKLSVYKENSDCEVCVHWYSGGCDGYRQGVIDYKKSSDKPLDVIIDHVEQNLNLDGCISWERYPINLTKAEMKDVEYYD